MIVKTQADAALFTECLEFELGVLPKGRLWRQIFEESMWGFRFVLNTSPLSPQGRLWRHIFEKVLGGSDFSRTHSSTHAKSKIGGRNIRDPRNVSSDCCSRGAHNLQSEHAFSPKIWKKWDTFCQYWHYFLHCIGWSEYLRCCTQSDSSSWASQSSIHKITPKAAHQSWSIIVLRVNIKIKQCWKYNIIM